MCAVVDSGLFVSLSNKIVFYDRVRN